MENTKLHKLTLRLMMFRKCKSVRGKSEQQSYLGFLANPSEHNSAIMTSVASRLRSQTNYDVKISQTPICTKDPAQEQYLLISRFTSWS